MNQPGYFELAWSFFKINLVTFGGGYSIVPIISKTYVEKKKYIEEEDMLNMIALAQSCPGAMAVNTSVLVGYRLRGKLGALVSLIGAILPPLLIITIISYYYTAFQSNMLIQSVLNGMRGAVCAVMLYTSITMARNALKKNVVFSGLLLLGAYTFGVFTKISTIYIILVCGFIGYIYFSVIKKAKGDQV